MALLRGSGPQYHGEIEPCEKCERVARLNARYKGEYYSFVIGSHIILYNHFHWLERRVNGSARNH